MIFFALLFLAVPVAAVIQFFVPPLEWLWNARLMLVHIVFLFGAFALPFHSMLIFAAYAGLFWDLIELPISASIIAPHPGWSCIVFALFGGAVSGLRPLFIKGRWEVHCLASGSCTMIYLLLQFLYITWLRGQPEFEPAVWGRIGGAGILAFFTAPLVYVVFSQLLRLTGYKMRHETRPAFA